MEGLGLNSQKIAIILAVCCLALPVIVVTLVYQNPKFSLSAKADDFGGKIGSFQPTNKSGVSAKAEDFGGKIGSFQPTNKSDDFGGQRGSFQPTNKSDDLGGNRGSFQPTNKSYDFGGKRGSFQPTNKSGDELMASGFEKASCFSRYESYLLRKISPHKPSPSLISKLRDYEHLHRRCGPNTKSYNTTIRKLRKKSTSGSGKCKYIVWTGANGLGNRMISIASTFLYAVLTNRTLLVNFEPEMTGLFCEPFPNSTWLLPQDFPHHYQKIELEDYETMLKSNVAANSKRFSHSFLFINLEHGYHDQAKFFHCDHTQELIKQAPAVILQSDQYFAPSLFAIPSFEQELMKMFPEKETVFHHLGNYLFHPSNEAWGLITRFHNAYLEMADQKIGLQIRVFNPNRTPIQTVMDQILSCTQNHSLLPEVSESKIETLSKNRTRKAVLVASLYSEYAEQLRAMYLTKPTVTGETIGVFQPSHEEHQKFHDNAHNMKAWTEIYLLSLCDVLVTSGLSTFGYVGQSLGGVKPWILRKQNNAQIPNPPCGEALSMEPCFHLPPQLDCSTKTQMDFGSGFPFLRQCEDIRQGVKLVDG